MSLELGNRPVCTANYDQDKGPRLISGVTSGLGPVHETGLIASRVEGRGSPYDRVVGDDEMAASQPVQ